jgi:hypothetical protein
VDLRTREGRWYQELHDGLVSILNASVQRFEHIALVVARGHCRWKATE